MQHTTSIVAYAQDETGYLFYHTHTNYYTPIVTDAI